MGKKILYGDIHGKKYNYLTIIADAGQIKKGVRNRKCVLVQCDCGTVKTVQFDHLERGYAMSCGCYLKKRKAELAKHGLWLHPLYTVWIDMKSRCYNSKHISWKWYGGRGVAVCPEWVNSFKSFYDWAGDKWAIGLQLDKDIIGDGNLYSPKTCCFVTSKMNCRSKQKTKKHTIKGVTKSLSEWCDIYNIKYATVLSRITMWGWDIHKALTSPLLKGGGGKHYKMDKVKLKALFFYKEQGKSIKEISSIIGIGTKHISDILHGKFKYCEDFYG